MEPIAGYLENKGTLADAGGVSPEERLRLFTQVYFSSFRLKTKLLTKTTKTAATLVSPFPSPKHRTLAQNPGRISEWSLTETQTEI